MRRSLYLRALLCLLWAGLPAASPTPVTPTTAPATQPTEEERFLSMVTKLASPEFEGRGSQTKGLQLAEKYLVEQYRRADLKPAFGKQYTQSFPISAGLKVTEQKFAVHPDSGGKPVQLKPGKTFNIMGAGGTGAVSETEAVFVGYSIIAPDRDHRSYDESSQETLKGKVAVMFRYEPHSSKGHSLWTRRKPWSAAAALNSKLALAKKNGAVAAIVVNPPAVGKGRPSSPASTYRPGLKNMPVLNITSDGFEKILQAAGADSPEGKHRELLGKANAGKPCVIPLGVKISAGAEFKPVQKEVRNVAAVLPGAGELAEEVIVLGGHYDHLGYGFGVSEKRARYYPGADDNASGAAGVVFVARRMRKWANSAKAPTNRRTILFVNFAAEEIGLLGSAHFVEQFEETGFKLDQLVAMINLDMIGRVRNDQITAWGADSADCWRPMLENLKEETALKLLPGGSGLGPSDQLSFYRRKIPVLFFNNGLHSDLHKPTDTPDKINAAAAVEVIDLVSALMQKLSVRSKPVVYRTPEGKSEKVTLGVVPEMEHTGKGSRIKSVQPGSAADKAGLKAGDIVTQWNDVPIINVISLIQQIRSARKGHTVKLSVLRDGKELALKVRL
ncbi:MAG: M28 family peptidase [Phycisphaerae bacterium]